MDYQIKRRRSAYKKQEIVMKLLILMEKTKIREEFFATLVAWTKEVWTTGFNFAADVCCCHELAQDMV